MNDTSISSQFTVNGLPGEYSERVARAAEEVWSTGAEHATTLLRPVEDKRV